MIPRIAQAYFKEYAAHFKVVALTGPRQSGKTTLVRHVFPDKAYVSLERPDIRQFAQDDPIGFLKNYPNGAILDEIQQVPQLFSYLQGIVDDSIDKGLFFLTGSNNFLLQENITQSLAGRVAYLNLLPFEIGELYPENGIPSIDELLIGGFYPPVHDQHIPAPIWASNYLRTYVERDVRFIKNIVDLRSFELFLRILAGRNGAELNLSTLATEVGVDVKTIQSWIGILETSFVIFLLKPYHKNFNKIVVKRPKVYFYDTSLVCSLLNITELRHLEHHPLKGNLFEGFVVSEMMKYRIHRGKPNNLYYWRDKHGNEIDVLVDSPAGLYPIEIKLGQTIQKSFFKNLRFMNKISEEIGGAVIYGGDESQVRSDSFHCVGFRKMRNLFDEVLA